jgi:hypothetical protein
MIISIWMDVIGVGLMRDIIQPSPQARRTWITSCSASFRPALDWIHDRAMLGGPLSERLESIYSNRTGKQFYVLPRKSN